MNPSRIFTKRRMGLDSNVWLIMLLLMILSAGLLGYKVIDNNNKPCGQVDIVINGLSNDDNHSYNIGEPLLFRAGISSREKIIWDFDDNSKKEEGFTTSHIFKEPKIYNVTVTVNGNCESVAILHIKKPMSQAKYTPHPIVTNSIIGANEINVRVDEKYFTPLVADSYEWSIKDNVNFVTRKGKEATFRFKTPGTYTIQLVLNHDNQKKYTKTIYVIDPLSKAKTNAGFEQPRVLVPDYPVPDKKPEQNPVTQNQQSQNQSVAPPPVTVNPLPVDNTSKKTEDQPVVHKLVSNNTLKAMLEGGAPPDEFNVFLCDDGNTKVNENGKWSTFAQFYKNITGKKIEFESVEQVKENDCIVNLTVKYKKKKSWPFGIGN